MVHGHDSINLLRSKKYQIVIMCQYFLVYDQILLVDTFGLEEVFVVLGSGLLVYGQKLPSYRFYVKIYFTLSSVGTRDVKIQGACDLNMNLS
jgi:hypothetical protein